jgi:hypothetical protein
MLSRRGTSYVFGDASPVAITSHGTLDVHPIVSDRTNALS